jgi:hypothetical protein
MIRIAFAIAVAIMGIAAVSGTSQAAPIAPLAGVTATDGGNVTQVYWGYHRGWGYHRHCWRGWHGYIHCR